MSDSHSFKVTLEQEEGYEFVAKFDSPGVEALLLDEPPPLGGGRGPNAARLVAAAVANCLSASLVFCVRGKFKQPLFPLHAEATGRLERDSRGHFRIAGIDVKISLSQSAGALQHFDRCAAQFEDFCIVTQSIRDGIPVSVEVVDGAGLSVHRSGAAVPAS